MPSIPVVVRKYIERCLERKGRCRKGRVLWLRSGCEGLGRGLHIARPFSQRRKLRHASLTPFLHRNTSLIFDASAPPRSVMFISRLGRLSAGPQGRCEFYHLFVFEGIGIFAIYFTTPAKPVAFKPPLPVADRDLFTTLDVAICVSCYNAIFAVVLPHVHAGIRFAGVGSEAEEGAEVHCVEPADGLRRVAVTLSVVGFAPCFDVNSFV